MLYFSQFFINFATEKKRQTLVFSLNSDANCLNTLYLCCIALWLMPNCAVL